MGAKIRKNQNSYILLMLNIRYPVN